LEGVYIVIKARKTDAKYECHIRGKKLQAELPHNHVN